MKSKESHAEPERAENPFTSADVAAILKERNWIGHQPSGRQLAWCERTAALLGPQAQDMAGLTDLLSLVFEYEPAKLLAQPENHAALARYAARDVVRQVALQVLNGGALTPEYFSQIVTNLKDSLELSGRELFHPLRLALAGRTGGGEMDRVILLLDEAAAAGFNTRVKSARERMIEFCTALD
jgi:nondiscriminating glutamyl-tRNA synthetase